jgi:hypothetical protein
MIGWRLWVLVLLPVAAAPAPASAQHWPDDQCVDNPNLAPCLQSRADGLAEIYGVRRIEAHRDAGDEVVRVFYIKDGDLALITLVRSPGRDPTAYVHFPQARNQSAATPMQAPISQAEWSEALYRAAYADRSLVSLPEDPEVQTICIHPWTYVFEASVPADAVYGRSARVRRYSASSCDDAPLLYFAADLQRLVLPLFPTCDALDRNRYGNAVQRLIQCQRLYGDRLAAAEVMNLASAFDRIGESEGPHALDHLFAWDAAIDWNGHRHAANDRETAAFWRARIAEDGVSNFHIERAEGQSRNRVRVTGYLYRNQPGTNDGTQSRAPFEQIWAATASGIQVTSITVGPWEVYRAR